MEALILIISAFFASWLTFFSGFGLGTILTPVFYFVFNDLVLAIAATAIVHFLNNVFKFTLMQKKVDWKIALPFGLASIPAAVAGAWLLGTFDDRVLFAWNFINGAHEVYLMNFIFGVLLIFFSLMEIVPRLNFSFDHSKLWVGGLISGFFGGLSGHQGALRTAFLSRYKLDKEVFIATGIVIALAVDIARTGIYFYDTDITIIRQRWELVTFALLAALAGAITGKYFLKKLNSQALTIIIAVSMFIFGIALAMGFLETR
jgi:uncharacterized protein